MNEPEGLPRLVPELPLPPYTHIPGRTPHPISDPRGHSHGLTPERSAAPEAARWRECRSYLRGIDLFNHGCYWEAHEAWESLWHGCGRRGAQADFIKGLIQLAVAGVKVREGVRAGTVQHARRAAELFRATAGCVGDVSVRYMGLALEELVAFAETIAARPPVSEHAAIAIEVVFDHVLRPA